jgi:exonuclease SbcD
VLDIHVFSTLRRDGENLRPDRHFIPLKGPDGALVAHVCAIPFLRASDLPGLSFATGKGKGEGSPIVDAARRLHDIFAEHAETICDGKPVIAMGHLHCRGANEDTGETADRGIIIGGEHAVPTDIYPPVFSYVALGHIHRAQSLDGGRIRYCGSPFPLSASETGYRHGVTIVDVTEDGITHHHHEIPRPVEFFRFPAQGTIVYEDFDDALAGIDPELYDNPDMYPFVYVNLEATGPAAVLMRDAETMISEAPVRLAGLRVTRSAEEAPDIELDLQSLDETTPEDLFLSTFLKINKTEAGDRHLMAFRTALTGDD